MENTTQRLDKFLANQGICSRRSTDKLLKQQILTVNGQRVKESGTRIDPMKDDIRLNNEKIEPPKLVYYLLNKPKGIISTTSDEFGRIDVTSLIPVKERIYPVGRLDKDTTGLILLTNDGDLTHKLTHPKYHIQKVYKLIIKGKINKRQLQAFRNGVLLDDYLTAPAQVKTIKENNTHSIIEVTIHEGKYRQIRRMCEEVGIKLLELERIKFGPVSIGNLQEGKYRHLSDKEISLLKSGHSRGGFPFAP